MERDAKTARGSLPVLLTSVKGPDGGAAIADWVSRRLTERSTARA